MKNFLFAPLLFLLLVSCKKSTDGSTYNTSIEQSFTNVSYGSDTAQRMDIYLPADRSAVSTKAMILIHGGAWTTGDKNEFNQYILTLKSLFPDYAIFNINYRLATINSNFFPAQENDVKAAVDFIASKAPEYSFNAGKMVVFGASAGGHLALLQAYKYSTPKIKAVVDFFGPVDMVTLYNSSTSMTQTGLQLLLSGTPASNPTNYQASSPINSITNQSPPTIIFHGEKDVLVPVAQSIALKNKLASLGVAHELHIYPNEGHAWYGATLDDSFKKIAAFLLTHVP